MKKKNEERRTTDNKKNEEEKRFGRKFRCFDIIYDLCTTVVIPSLAGIAGGTAALVRTTAVCCVNQEKGQDGQSNQ